MEGMGGLGRDEGMEGGTEGCTEGGIGQTNDASPCPRLSQCTLCSPHPPSTHPPPPEHY